MNWNTEVFEVKPEAELVEHCNLLDGAVFGHDGKRFIKVRDNSAGVRKCVRLSSGGKAVIVGLDAYTKVMPLPFIARIVIEPITPTAK